MIDCILIEVDHADTLGGSCVGDIYGTLKVLSKMKNIGTINVLTTHNLCKSDKDKIPIKNVKYELIDKLLYQMRNIIMKVDSKDDLFILISGHGYQTKDLSGDEEDGYDEYIRTKTEMIIDDDLKLVAYSGKAKTVRVICDTCHSGSMFDFKNMGVPKPSYKAISLGSSRDNQLSSCDLSYVYGYGGALIVFLIDSELLSDFLYGKNLGSIYIKAKKYLQPLGQTPVMAYE
jgi:hypothetical protein